MFQRPARWLLMSSLMVMLVVLATGGVFGIPLGALAQGTVPPRPTLNPTQRPLTVEPIETIRATLSATAAAPTATSTQTAQATRSNTPTLSPSPAPASRTPTQAATTAPPPATPPPTPQSVPVTGGSQPFAAQWRMLLVFSAGISMLCFVAGVYVGLDSRRRHNS